MSDFKIVNLINGGARISEYNSGFSEQSPVRIFEVNKGQFDHIKQAILEDKQIRATVLEEVYKRLKDEMQYTAGCYYIPLIELKELFTELKENSTAVGKECPR